VLLHEAETGTVSLTPRLLPSVVLPEDAATARVLQGVRLIAEWPDSPGAR
jgi:hypothetical protein